ncbi:amidohydrolase [Rhodobacter sp.]
MPAMFPVDLVLVNADVVTLDPFAPRAQALAIAAGRIVALGGSAAMRALAGPGARVIDAGGRMVLPGLQDTHIHLQDSGFDYGGSAALDAARDVDALVALLAQFAASSRAPWVTGVGWYTGVFNDANLTRQVLDRAVPDRPCFVYGSDGHNACINTAACAALGLVAGTADPPGGHFVLDPDGQPTGMLHEAAVSWVRDRMPAPTDADYADGVRYGQALANRHGITGVLDASVQERHVRVYRAMAKAGALTLRVASTARVDPAEATADALDRVLTLRHEAAGHGMFKVHSAKFFVDGVFENRTATMLAPYSDAKGGNAPTLFAPEQIPELFTAFDAARFQIHVHVIGDGATRAALDGLEAAQRANGIWPALHQLAHVQCIDPADIPRFAALGAVANIQPYWARHAPSTALTLDMVGPERGRLMYAFRSLLDAGAGYALSSDWGVTTLNPFRIMETAMTRQPPGGGPDPFLPREVLTRAECLLGYTARAADTAWRGQETGRLTPGRLADLIVVDRDVLACDPYAFGATEVLLTLVGGAEVWRAPGFDG